MSRDFYVHDELSEDAFRGISSLSCHPRKLLFFSDELAAILEDDQPWEPCTLLYFLRGCHACGFPSISYTVTNCFVNGRARHTSAFQEKRWLLQSDVLHKGGFRDGFAVLTCVRPTPTCWSEKIGRIKFFSVTSMPPWKGKIVNHPNATWSYVWVSQK